MVGRYITTPDKKTRAESCSMRTVMSTDCRTDAAVLQRARVAGVVDVAGCRSESCWLAAAAGAAA